MGDALYFLLISFLKKEGIDVNQNELKLQLLSHPSYPSLHSVTGVLSHFGIENMALEVPKNRETLYQLPDNFITILSKENEFVIVTQHDTSVELLYGSKKKKIVSVNDFLDMWSGIIVVIENENVETLSNNNINTTLSNSLYFLSIAVVLGVFFYAKPSLFETVHFSLTLIGIGISYLILKHEFGFHSKALDKFCTATETTSCDAVLNSKGASLSKYFKLSDLSFIYFTALALSWLFSVNFSVINHAAIIISLLALPITFYSIYYQYNVVKKWCPLCLSIVAVLWLQAGTLFLSHFSLTSIQPDALSSFLLFFSFLLVTSLWLFIKPLLKKQQDLEKLEIEHYKFKRNFELFNAVYSKGEFIDTAIHTSKEIVLGEKNAPIQILLVTNPSCYYCKEAHTDIEKLLANNTNEVNAIIRFNVSSDITNIAYKVAHRLLEIYDTEPIEILEKALHEVYKSNTDLNKWLIKWNESTTDSFAKELEIQQRWCHDNTINFTPALFINGKPFPKEYNRSDVNYFIEELIELAETEISQPNSTLEVVN